MKGSVAREYSLARTPAMDCSAVRKYSGNSGGSGRSCPQAMLAAFVFPTWLQSVAAKLFVDLAEPARRTLARSGFGELASSLGITDDFEQPVKSLKSLRRAQSSRRAR